jgi:hypothetical protein
LLCLTYPLNLLKGQNKDWIWFLWPNISLPTGEK